MIKNPTRSDWEYALKSRIFIEGEPNDALYERAVRLFTQKGGIAEDCLKSMSLPPKMHVYSGINLPEGVNVIDEDGKTLHIAFGGKSDAVIFKSIMQAYNYSPDNIQDIQRRNSAGMRTEVSAEKRMDRDRHEDIHANKKLRIVNRAANRTCGEYDILQSANRDKARLNSYGQLVDWHEEYKNHLSAKENEPQQVTLWEWYQQQMFAERTMQRFSGKADIVKADGTKIKDFPLNKDWLRGLRIMCGLSTNDAAAILHIPQATYSSTENHGLSITPYMVNRILACNLFHLPEIEVEGKKIIDPAYTLKFLDMCGVGREPIIERGQFFPAIKAAVEAYRRGDMTYEQLPTINSMIAFLSDDPLSKKAHSRAAHPASVKGLKEGSTVHKHVDKFKDLFIHHGVDYTDYFVALPSVSKSGKIHPSPIATKLSDDESFERAIGASENIPQFLKAYMELSRQGLKEIASRAGCTFQNIQQFTVGENVTAHKLARILDPKNIFRLPVDKDGNIKPEVMEHLKGLCAKGPRSGQYKTSKLYNVEAYEYAKNKATTASELLKLYVQATHQSISQISRRIGRSEHLISKILKENSLNDSRLEFIFGMSNPFALPIDKHGKIQSGVVAFIKELNSEFLEQWCQDTADEIPWAKRFAAQNKKPFLTKGGQSVTGNDASSDSIAEEEMRPERSYTSVARLKDDKGQTPIR